MGYSVLSTCYTNMVQVETEIYSSTFGFPYNYSTYWEPAKHPVEVLMEVLVVHSTNLAFYETASKKKLLKSLRFHKKKNM